MKKDLFLIIFLWFSVFSFAADFSVGPLDYEIVSLKNKTVKPVALNQSVEILDIPYSVEYDGKTFTVPYISGIHGYFGTTEYYSGVKQVILHEGLTKLGGAFSNYTSLETVVFPNSLKSIGESNGYGETFKGCSSLKEITIPETVDSISGAIFKDCINLTSVRFLGNPLFGYLGPNNSIYATSGVFKNCKSLQNINLPQNIKIIGKEFFCGCTNLTTINLPESCTAICDNAFKDCISLKELTFPKQLNGIGYSAFEKSGLSGKIQLPDNIRTIDYRAFSECKDITSFVFPNNCCLEVGGSVLTGCNNIESITFPSNGGIFKGTICDSDKLKEINCLSYYPPNISGEIFPNSVLIKSTLNILTGASNEFTNSNQWGNFTKIIETFDNPGFSTLDIVLNVPDTYKSVYEILYPERTFTIQNGNSLKIDVSYTSLGFGHIEDDYKEFVPYFNEYPISFSATYTTTKSLDIIERPESLLLDGARFYITPPLFQDATFYINYDSSGVPEIVSNENETDEIKIYALSGILVNSSIDNLLKGIYIIHRGKSVNKVIVR